MAALSGKDYMNYLAIFFLLYLIPSISILANENNFTLSAGVFNEFDGMRYGGDLSATLWGESLGFQASLVIYGAGRALDTNKNEYTGLSIFTFYHIDLDLINPYIGFGVLGGITDNCPEDNDINEPDYCWEDYAFAAYSEFGLAINISDFEVKPYLRRYTDTILDENSKNVIGLSVGKKF
jgi:hypothetical protein